MFVAAVSAVMGNAAPAGASGGVARTDGAAARSQAAHVEHRQLDSSWNGVAMTCLETKVVNVHLRKETFHCQLPGVTAARAQVYDETTAFWSSDFDGAPATALHIVISPSGSFNGWAVY